MDWQWLKQVRIGKSVLISEDFASELLLMSLCDHHIMSASSFSMWGMYDCFISCHYVCMSVLLMYIWKNYWHRCLTVIHGESHQKRRASGIHSPYHIHNAQGHSNTK
jgi:hypothetical protein